MKILLLLIFIFFSFISASAQVCGTYTTTLVIKSEDNKSLENAVVQLLALEKDETRNKSFSRDETDRSRFFITFSEGHIVGGKYKLIVSADGFETAEKEVTFPHCKRQTFEFTLKANKATNESILTGTVYDAQGSVIVKAKVSAVNQKGEKFETVTNDEGVYSLNLPFNQYSTINFKEARYDIIVEAANFRKSTIKDFVFIPSQFGKMHLDVGLGILTIIDTVPVSPKKGKKSKNN